MAVLTNPTEEYIDEEKRVSQVYMALKKAEELFYKQKSRVQVIKEGDSNTSFFHKTVKVKTQRQQIIRMLNEQGEVTTDIKEIGEVAVEFYTKLIGTKDLNVEQHYVGFYQDLLKHKLSVDEQALLMSGISRAQVKQAFLKLEKDKAPGHDGFPAKFFTTHWDIVGGKLRR
ncbi:unnamed protein product [Linum trigynum]|uniref:Uncharacterized protein n=1 Tax=Linum trigynum TaxID=586398 RepID=A0AAV2DZG9_9ROSI